MLQQKWLLVYGLQQRRLLVTAILRHRPSQKLVMLLLTALAAAAVIGPDLVERRVHISRTLRSRVHIKSGRLPTETDCGGPWIYASACRHAKVRQQPFMCQVCRSWAVLDRVVSAHEGNLSSKVSGDLVSHATHAAQAIELLQAIIKRNGAATVCETGFNAGHSALLFLALPHADTRTPQPQRTSPATLAACDFLACCVRNQRHRGAAPPLSKPRASQSRPSTLPEGSRCHVRTGLPEAYVSCTVCAYHSPHRRCLTRPS